MHPRRPSSKPISIAREDKRGRSASQRGYHRTYRVPRSPGGQIGFLELPPLRHYLEGYRRIIITETGLKLESAGVSLNQTAHALGVPVTSYFTWRKAYQTGGPNALFPKWLNQSPRPSRKSPALCRLTFILKT